MSIRLHETLGVNPKLCVCPRCGGENGELVLIGAATSIRQCPECKVHIYGGRPTFNSCPSCKKHVHDFPIIGRVGENDKIPTSLCSGCKAEIETHMQIVAEGGIHFKCAKCPVTGVLRGTSELAIAVRKQMNLPAPAPCGVEFAECAEHTV